MNKFSVALLSSLATIGIGTGVVLVAGQFPSVKGKLNIAFGESNKIESDKVIGDEDISNLPLADAQFKQELYKRGYVIVNYARVGTSNYEICPINSIVDYQNHPIKEGSYFVGWSTTEDGLNPVLSVEESTTLYPIFKQAYEGDVTIFTHTGDGYIWSIENAMNSLWVNQQSIFDNGTEYKVNIIGWSTSPDSIELVTELQHGGSYYAVYNVQPVDKVMSCAEANIVTTKLIYGENAFNTIQFEGVNFSSPILMRDYCLDEIPSITILDKTYDCIGIANAIDSVETLSIRYCGAGDVYYGVYHCIETGEILSTQYLMDYKHYVDNKEPVRIILNAGYQAENIKVFNGTEVDNWFYDNCQSIYFNGKFYHPVGISASEDSYDIVDSYVDGEAYYIVYSSDDGEMMTSAQYSRDVRVLCGDVVFHASCEFMKTFDSYSLGNDVFEVVGCSLDLSSTQVLSDEELVSLRFSETDVYVVFRYDGRLYSYSTFMSDIYHKPYFLSVNWYNGVSTNTRMIEQYETHISVNNGQSYYRFAGWTNSADSNVVLDDISQCNEIYAVYQDVLSTSGTKYSYNTLRNLIKYGNPQPVDEIPEKVTISFHTYKDVNGTLNQMGSTGFGKASMTVTQMNSLLVELPNLTFVGWAESTSAKSGALDHINHTYIQSGGLMISTNKTYVAVYSFDDNGTTKYLCALNTTTNKSLLAEITSRVPEEDLVIKVFTRTGETTLSIGSGESVDDNISTILEKELYIDDTLTFTYAGLSNYGSWTGVVADEDLDEETLYFPVYINSRNNQATSFTEVMMYTDDFKEYQIYNYRNITFMQSFYFDELDYMGTFEALRHDYQIDVNVQGTWYYACGLSTSGDSAECIDFATLDESATYYYVYADAEGNLYTCNQVTEFWDNQSA